MKEKLLNIYERASSYVFILLNLILIPVYFVPCFHEVGIFDSANGGAPIRRDYYYSAYDNFKLDGSIHVLYLAIVASIFSVLLSVISLIFGKSKKARLAALFGFLMSVLIFSASMLFASTIYRAY